MSLYDLNFVPRVHPKIIDLSNPIPPPLPRTPGLHQKISLPPSGVARAIFDEMRGTSRGIPAHSDEVLIRDGHGVGITNVFELPAIGEMGVANDKKLEIVNLTRDAHRIIWTDSVGGAREITLDGLGANARLRVIAGAWVVLNLFNAKVK
jgi:hypothetical protein